MRPNDWNKILAGLTILAPIPYVAYAETYLTETQAAAILFPDARVELKWVDLTKDEARAIEKASGERVRQPRARVWLAPNRAALFIDQVVGKHEFITYAVAVSTDGTVKGVEIMDYRETYGSEVRRPEWRRQFVGKAAKDPLKVEKDIRNISGATLSSVHVTDGVRRILRTYEILRAKA